LGLIAGVQEFLTDSYPVASEKRPELFDRHPVYPRCTAVPLNPPQRAEHILPLQYAL
jgi:hypothetical protein